MDPQLFAVDWPRLMEALAVLVLLSMIVERALSIVFESQAFLDWVKQPKNAAWKFAREGLAFAVSVVVCAFWNFDVISILLSAPTTNWVGYVATGAVIAGGSKGSIKLFRDFLGFKSGAYREYEQQRDLEKSRRLAAQGSQQ